MIGGSRSEQNLFRGAGAKRVGSPLVEDWWHPTQLKAQFSFLICATDNNN